MRLRLLLAAITLPLAVSNGYSGVIHVTGVRSWSHPGSTRVVLELTGPAEYRADRVENPDRLFFDISGATPLLNGKRVASHQIDDGLVTRVRIAETRPGTTRVVFDLARKAEYKISTLDTPSRIVIELTPTGVPEITPVTPRVYTPPAVKRRSPVLVALPELPSGDELFTAQLAPLVLADLPKPRLPKKFVPPATQPTAPVVAGPFVNTTTKVLPALPQPETKTTAKASSAADMSLTRVLGLKINRIVIDAGHGGHDDGTIGAHGVLEKDVVLDVALRLAALVQTKLGAEVVLTRSDDTFVPLTERTAIANQYKGDLFLSIHANSSPSTPGVAGTETFLLSTVSSPGATAVAARENAMANKSVGELRDLIQTIALNDKITESTTFANDIEASIAAQAARGNPAAHDRGIKKAPFVVLIGARMPSVLAEIGFLSNTKEETNLNKPDYRQKVAESLLRGITKYSQSLSHYELAALK